MEALMNSLQNLKINRSRIDVQYFGPYRESVAIELGCLTLKDPELKRRLLDDPQADFYLTGLGATGGTRCSALGSRTLVDGLGIHNRCCDL